LNVGVYIFLSSIKSHSYEMPHSESIMIHALPSKSS